MQAKQSYIENWKKIFINENTVSVQTLNPGNFYKIEVYKYADGKTKTLAGVNTAYIFVIGKFTDSGQKYFAALKLKNVNPLYFFNDIKLMLSPSPSTDKAIDTAYSEENENRHEEFSSLLRKIPKDGRNLFSALKRKSRIYEGNYREYIVSSVRNIKSVDIDSEFLKTVLTKNAKKSKNVKEAKEKINTVKTQK